MIELTSTSKKFILHWGEMGSRWGINRTVAQIHALLYISPRPLNAEEISETLSVARSTVSTSLHELQNWGIIKVVHVLGDRRDHFEAVDDVWAMFRIVVEERKRRELDPTLEILREVVAEMENGTPENVQVKEKLDEMLAFFETIVNLYEQVQGLPTESLLSVAKMGDLATRLIRLSSGSKK